MEAVLHTNVDGRGRQRETDKAQRGGRLRLLYRGPLEPHNLPLGPCDREMGNELRAKLFETWGWGLAVVVVTRAYVWHAPPQRPGGSLPAGRLRHDVQFVVAVKHVVEDAHSEPRVVDAVAGLEENACLEQPEASLHSSIAALDVLAHTLQPSAPVMLLDRGMVLDGRYEQGDLVWAHRKREREREKERRGRPDIFLLQGVQQRQSTIQRH